MIFTVFVIVLAVIGFLLVTGFGAAEVVTIVHTPPIKNARAFKTIAWWYVESLVFLILATLCSLMFFREHDWFYGVIGIIETLAVFILAVWRDLRTFTKVDRKVTGVDYKATGPYVDGI